jgi:hypothetical protein
VIKTTTPRTFYTGQDKYTTDKYITVDIFDKLRKFYIMPNDFPLIEDDFPSLEKYNYEISNDKIKLDNNIIYFQKPKTIPPGKSRVRAIYLEGKPTRVCFLNSGETEKEISIEIINSNDLEQNSKR